MVYVGLTTESIFDTLSTVDENERKRTKTKRTEGDDEEERIEAERTHPAPWQRHRLIVAQAGW